MYNIISEIEDDSKMFKFNFIIENVKLKHCKPDLILISFKFNCCFFITECTGGRKITACKDS